MVLLKMGIWLLEMEQATSYEAFAVNDDNGGDLTSGNITIGTNDGY